MFRKKLVYCFLVFWVSVFFVWNNVGALSGEEFRIIDGDTFEILSEGSKCRLLYVDAPEKAQPYGKEATEYLAKLMSHVNAILTVQDIEGRVGKVKETDIYGRKMVLVVLEEGTVQEEMVKAGLAMVFEAFCKEEYYCELLRKAQEQARKDRVGIWSDGDPIPPWEFRRMKKVKQ
jgi:endonuclease YncB( thermonuclease family)